MSKAKKAKVLISKTAKQSNITDELAEDIIDFFYSQLVKKMENLEYTNLRVPMLGTFSISKKKLSDSVNTLTRLLDSNDQETFNKLRLYKIDDKLKEKQSLLLKKVKSQENERTELKARYKRNMEKQEKNSRGNKK